MKLTIKPIIYSMPALTMAMTAQADILIPGAVAPAPVPGRPSQAPPVLRSDLLASNAVHAIFKGIKTLPKVGLDDSATFEEVAVFEVKQNLAYRRYDRMGDGAMTPGSLVGVSLATDMPGQDAALSEKLRSLQPGDEAIMNIDHIYVFKEDGNRNMRPCTRFAQVQPRQPEPIPAAPTSAPSAPVADTPAQALPSALMQPSAPSPVIIKSSRAVVRNVVETPDGGRTCTEDIVETGNDGKTTRRRFINGVEVDPETNQPLSATPASPSAQPEEPLPSEDTPEPADTELPPIPEPTADH